MHSKSVANFTENMLSTFQKISLLKVCGQLLSGNMLQTPIENPHSGGRLPPPADFPEGPHLDPTSGKTIKMTICFSTFSSSAFTIGPFDVGQTSLSVRCHQSPMLSVPEVFSRLSTGFCFRHFHFFFGHWFFCTWESHVEMVYLYRICIFFNFLTSYGRHFL